MLNEKWKIIPTIKKYECSNLGNFRSINTKRLLKKYQTNEGYVIVGILAKTYPVHRLLAITWIPNPENKPTVEHIDRNRLNNELSNLKWATFSEQSQNQSRSKYQINGRKIWKCDPITNEKIKLYNNAVEALRLNNIDKSSASLIKFLKNNEIYCGFKWMYDDISDLENEVWVLFKTVISEKSNSKHKYYVSNYGRVKNNTRLLKAYGEVYSHHWFDNKSYKTHRLVAQCFLENPNNYEMVNHIDGNPMNNNVSNLEWCSASQNSKHAISNGLKKSIKKIIQYDISNYNIISIYESAVQAAEQTGIDRGVIMNNCLGKSINGCGRCKLYFKFLDDTDDLLNNQITKIPTSDKSKGLAGIPRKIRIETKEGEEVVCNSIKEASRTFNISVKIIVSCCIGKRESYNDYIFTYY